MLVQSDTGDWLLVSDGAIDTNLHFVCFSIWEDEEKP